jgi:hypothetical protein
VRAELDGASHAKRQNWPCSCHQESVAHWLASAVSVQMMMTMIMGLMMNQKILRGEASGIGILEGARLCVCVCAHQREAQRVRMGMGSQGSWDMRQENPRRSPAAQHTQCERRSSTHCAADGALPALCSNLGPAAPARHH